MAFAEEVVHVWREWGIGALMLLSFTFQVALLILAMFRRHVDSGVLKFFTWSADMLADSTAIYVLGHMALTGSGSSPERRELTAFWAPFLLVHLGGQDNITAYAIEDNKLWLRHLQTLVVEVAATAYILYQSSSILGGSSTSSRGSSVLLRWATALMFVVGVVKYGERAWALWRAGRRSETAGCNDNYRSMEKTVTLANVYLGSLERPRENKEHVVGLAHSLLEISKELLWKRTTSKKWWYVRINGRIAYAAAELQLSLMHDVLYTKTPVMSSWHGISIRVASVLATAVALLLFHYSLGYYHGGVSLFDVTVTYVVSVGAVALEVVSAARVTFSSWIWAPKLMNWTRNHPASIRSTNPVLFFRHLFCAAQWRIGSSWSRSMGQHDMLSLCVRSSTSRSSRVARWVGLEDTWNVLAHSPPAVPVPKLVRAQIKDQVATNWKPNNLVNVEAQEKLRRWELYEGLAWTVEESILVWHVATGLYLVDTGRWTTAGTTTMPQAKAVQVLSNYMLFLLAERPYMLPPGTSRDAYVQMCYALKKKRRRSLYYQLPPLDYTSVEHLARSLLRLGNDINTGSVQRPDFSNVFGRSDPAMAVTAARLGAKLIGEEQDSSSSSSTGCYKVLDLLLKVWMDMLIYVSSRCSAESHAEQLSNGGELITVIALLAKYYTEDIIPTGEAASQAPVFPRRLSVYDFVTR